jgi:hypothetical protein
MRELARARSRYESAITELEQARDALSGEATLIAWLDSGVPTPQAILWEDASAPTPTAGSR